MWKDGYGFWSKGTKVKRFSSLPSCGIPQDGFVQAVLYRNEDGSRVLELWLKGKGASYRKSQVPCPPALAADFLRRARVEARVLRAERLELRAEAERLEAERRPRVESPDNMYRGCHEHDGSDKDLNPCYSDEMVAIYKRRRPGR